MMLKEYAVYDAEDNFVFMGDSKKCADFMNMTLGSFKSHITRVKQGKIKGRVGYLRAFEIKDDERK